MRTTPVVPQVGRAESRGSRSGELKIRVINSLDRPASHTSAWDDLWRRSGVTNPAARSAIIGNWLQHFAPHAEFRAIVVEQDGRWVAGLPLVGRRLMPFVTAGRLTRNSWSATGELLLDPHVDTERVLDVLVNGLGRIEWPLLILDQVALQAGQWRAFISALSRAGIPHSVREHYRVARVDIGDDWAAYESRLKGKDRRNRRRQSDKFKRAGMGGLRVISQPDPADLDELLRRGFQVEDRSWKGDQRTSILRVPGLSEYFSAEAHSLLKAGELRLAFLELNGRPIAFSYLWCSHGVVYLVKTGYDADFARLGPGQLMTMLLLQNLHQDGTTRMLDFVGPYSRWQKPWATATYPVGRIIVATPRRLGREMMRLYSTLQPHVRSLKQHVEAVPQFRGRRSLWGSQA